MRALAVLLIALGLGLTGPAAYAERWAAQDQRGDVSATTYDVDPAPEADPCAEVPEQRDRGDAERDLRRLAVDHTREAVTVTMTMREVRPRSTGTYWRMTLRTDRRDYELDLARYERGGGLEASLTKAPDYPDLTEVEGRAFAFASTVLFCEGLVADADELTDRVSVSIPRECLKRPRWVQVGASASSSADPDDAGLLTILADFRGPRGSTYADFVPPLSPRVRAS